MKTTVIVGACVTLLTWLALPAVGDDLFTGYNGHQYALTSNHGTWAECEAEAVAAGGHLATINDSGENAWLTEYIRDAYCRNNTADNHNGAWIGLKWNAGDKTNLNSWGWADGTPATYWNPDTRWDNGEHMYLIGPHHPVVPGKWGFNSIHNTNYNDMLMGIIEVAPPPPRVISAFGEWFDTDKKHLPTELHAGSWGTNHYNDENVDGKYTPGEEYAESEQPEWAHPSSSSDDSCWMAVANNMIRNYGGDDHYQDWAFNAGIRHDSETLTFANEGDVRWALKDAGYQYSHGAKGPACWMSAGVLDRIGTAETWISKRLSEGSAVGIGIIGTDIDHGVTIYSIDTDNKTITIADSDNDLGSYDPEVEGNFITVSYRTSYNKFEIKYKYGTWAEVISANAVRPLFVKIVEIVNPDFGQVLATGWNAYGTGLAQTVAYHSDPDNYVAELTSASPVMISQVLETPSQPFYLIFEYEFTTTSGTLEISLDSIVLGEITAPDELAGDLSTFTLYVLDPTILDLGEAIFEFQLNGEAGSQVLLDNITIQPVPEPATLSLLVLGGLALIRRRRK